MTDKFVAILMRSDSDLLQLEAAFGVLDKLNIRYETKDQALQEQLGK